MTQTTINKICLTPISIMLFLISGCGGVSQFSGGGSPTPESLGVAASLGATAIGLQPASLAQCSAGGSVMVVFRDANENGSYDSGETLISSQPICNGANGNAGMSAGVALSSAPIGSCAAGGTFVQTFRDANDNGNLDIGEAVVSSSTICNGTSGTNGLNASITSVAATVAQCPTGGVVYTSFVGGGASSVHIVCNGANGSNGQNAQFQIGAVGSPVAGKTYSACHHDYLFLPNAANPARGWLVFRHQSNGAADQGIGSTGFNVWNVDISSFSLASENLHVNYCNMLWNPLTRILQYTVVDASDGHVGETGSLQF